MNRFRLSLRLMLLLVTLFAVFFAGVGTLHQTQRVRRFPLVDRIEDLQLRRAELQRQLESTEPRQAGAIAASLSGVEADIARLKKRLSR
jgi:hypothetical protein